MRHCPLCPYLVRCFVFLTDVNGWTHPTRVAKGSQRNVYYSYDDLRESRYDDGYVRANYEVVDMLGGFGEGFCFDTNTLHQGSLGGGGGRDSLIFEFNAFEKSQVIRKCKVMCVCVRG